MIEHERLHGLQRNDLLDGVLVHVRGFFWHIVLGTGWVE